MLLAVLAAAYMSGRAQYQAMRDQQLEESRAGQQAAARTTALLLEQNIRLLATTIHAPDNRPASGEFLPRSWVRASARIGRANGKILAALDQDVAEIQSILTRLPELGRIDAPIVRVDGTRIILAAPAPDEQSVSVALLSNEQIASELLGAQPRSADLTAYLIVEGGTIVAAADNDSVGRHIEQIVSDPDAYRQIKSLIDANSVGTPVVDLPAPNGLSMLSVQPLSPLPESKWFLVLWRKNQREQIGQTLRPLVWQLVSGSTTMVLAVVGVLVSTTISLYRGRRRIEQLRMEMLDRDLQKARRIQLNWLPHPLLNTPDHAIAAENQPAAHISGDFYNWFDLPGEPNHNPRTAVVIGDVSGHGLPAAFLMATTQLIIKNTLPRLRDPGACLTELNQQLCSLVYQGQFVTILILSIDHQEGVIDMASAGQAGPLLKRDGQVRPVPLDPQLVAGVDASVLYATHRMRFQPGDQLLLYTDGVVETIDQAGVQFHLSGLIEAVQVAPDEPEHLLHSVLGAVASHRQGEDAEDDLTLVAIRLLSAARTDAASPDEAAMV